MKKEALKNRDYKTLTVFDLAVFLGVIVFLVTGLLQVSISPAIAFAITFVVCFVVISGFVFSKRKDINKNSTQ